MMQATTIRSDRARRFPAVTGLALAAVCALALFAPGPSSAQVASYGDKEAGQNQGDQLPNILQKVAVEQHLNQQLPLDAAFVDDTGKQVHLGDYFGKHPALVSLVYYNCPMLCSEELDGLTSSLEMVHLTPGKDFGRRRHQHRSLPRLRTLPRRRRRCT